jgi:hypothetical protein
MSAKDAAKALAETDKPTPNDVEKARRKLTALVKSGHLIISREGDRASNLTTLWATPNLLNQTITAPITAPLSVKASRPHHTHHGKSQNRRPETITAPITTITAPDHHDLSPP